MGEAGEHKHKLLITRLRLQEVPQRFLLVCPLQLYSRGAGPCSPLLLGGWRVQALGMLEAAVAVRADSRLFLPQVPPQGIH